MASMFCCQMLQGGSIHHLASVKVPLQALPLMHQFPIRKAYRKLGNTSTGADEIFSFNTHTAALGVSITGPIFTSSPSKSYSAWAKHAKFLMVPIHRMLYFSVSFQHGKLHNGTFSSLGQIPSLETWCARYTISVWKKEHLVKPTSKFQVEFSEALKYYP